MRVRVGHVRNRKFLTERGTKDKMGNMIVGIVVILILII